MTVNELLSSCWEYKRIKIFRDDYIPKYNEPLYYVTQKDLINEDVLCSQVSSWYMDNGNITIEIKVAY